MVVQLHTFLTLALVGREWSASLPGRFTPGLDAVAKEKILAPVGNRTLVVQPIA
jgi:hypothetical protein